MYLENVYMFTHPYFKAVVAVWVHSRDSSGLADRMPSQRLVLWLENIVAHGEHLPVHQWLQDEREACESCGKIWT